MPEPTLSKPPRLIRFVEATPPASLAERGPTDVILNIDVDEKGKVATVDVVQSGGPEFDAAAIAAVRQFEFEPGEADGKPVPVRITYSYHFVLKPPPEPPRPAPTAEGAAAPPQGPTAPISGRVLQKGNRVAMAGVVVIADDGAARAVTDEQGRFAFDALPVGTHTLKLRSPTITPADATVTSNEGKQLELTFYAEAKERYASTVRGQRAMVETVETTLRIEEIKRIPGTQGDTLKAVQNLPGVARAPFGIGLLSVWGSSPADTRVYVDGVAIPTLYHFGGLRSVVNSEMVGSLSFVPGGYQVEHGMGLGGTIDVATRPPRNDGLLHGYAQMDLIDGSLMLEGPLTKTLSFAVAGRRSWIDATLPYFTTSTLQLTPIYYDYQARLSWRPNKMDDVDVFFLGSDDQLNVAVNRSGPRSTTAASHIYWHRGIVSWLHRFGGGATLALTSSVGYEVPFQVGVQFGNVPTSIDARSLSYTTRALVDVPVREWLRLNAGIDYEGSRFTQDRIGVARPPIGGASGDSAGGFGGEPASFGGFQSGYAADNMTAYINHVAPFVSTKLTLLDKRLTIIPQLRLQVMSFAGYPGSDRSFTHTYVSPDPRLALRHQLVSRVALKAAIGMYSQPPSPEMLSRVFGNPDLVPQRAVHYVLGVDVDVTSTLRVEVDGFWKDMWDLVVRGEDPDGPALVSDGEGRAYGVQMLARQQLTKNFFGWISYTLSRAERKDSASDDWHRYQFDQTNILTLVGSYQLPRGFQVGARFRYVTGNPTTPVEGAYFDSNADRYIPLTGVPFSNRLPAFNQLDLRVDKVFTFDRWRFSAYLDVQNVFRSTNPEAINYNYNFTVAQPISGLPLLPILGLRGDF